MESSSPFPSKSPRVAIVGSGAIGGYYGAKLARADMDVNFLFRSDLNHVRRHGIRILSHDGNFDLPRVQAFGCAEEIGPCDWVLIALKATANMDLLKIIPSLLKPGTILLTLQNGLGNAEFLAEHFGAERVMGGLCFVCLNRVAPGTFQNFAHGAVVLGEFQRSASEKLRQFGQQWSAGGIHCKIVDDLEEARWRKLVWNIPFNGLSITEGGVDVAQILSDAPLLQRVRDLMNETILAANCLGHAIPSEFAQKQIDNTRSMGSYKPSSLIDFERGKPVEVEAIWGEPLRRGTQAGAHMPALDRLYSELKEWTKSAREIIASS